MKDEIVRAWEKYRSMHGKAQEASFRAGFGAGAAHITEKHQTINNAVQDVIDIMTRHIERLETRLETLGDRPPAEDPLKIMEDLNNLPTPKRLKLGNKMRTVDIKPKGDTDEAEKT